MSAEYSEDILVQQTASNYFQQELGWRTVYAYNDETYGPTGTLGRADQSEVLLLQPLHQALVRLNPGHPSEAYAAAIEQLLTTSAAKTWQQINEEKYCLIHDGIRVHYRTPDGQPRDPLLRVIDFNEPDNNDFLAVRELWVQGPIYRRRPDIIGFVNGIPLLFIELKRTSRSVQVAYEENYTDYRDTIPALFHYNAMVMLSNGIDARVGTLTSPFNFFHEWKRLSENEQGRVHFETMLKGICTKANFLDLVQNFILFDRSGGETVKILARNHQYLGVNRAFAAIGDRQAREGRLGVFWHTQGSGKSYSMAFLSEKAFCRISGGFTFLVVTDRKELDDQIVQTFMGVGAARSDNTQANDGNHLVELLEGNHRYVFTLIHKFNQPGKIYSKRDNIIVLCDEAHRTQYGTLADNMRRGLPNASFLAFTGTPLMESAEDQLTRDVFGGYVSTYNFKRAVDDNATVPLFYDNRGEKLSFVDESGEEHPLNGSEDLNQRVAEELSRYDLSEEDEERIMRRLGSDYLILTAEPRLDRIAEDLVAHYTTRWQTGKAMLVCLDKLTTVRMYNLIDKYWQQAIARQERRLAQATDDQDYKEQQQYLNWLRETEYAVVISEAQNEVKTFRDWGLDIEPHRAKMKARKLEEDFKNGQHPFRLVIVCAMWLTGFDVATLATLYMDKPMKGHSLMQTITRANRVAEGKNNGLLVDYNGILRSLRAALAKYANSDEDDQQPEGTPGPDDEDGRIPYKDMEKLRDDYADAIQACVDHLSSLGCDLQRLVEAEGFDRIHLLDPDATDSALNAISTNDESRARFDVLVRDIFKKKLALLSYPELTEPYQDRYAALDAIYKQLHQRQEIATDLNAVLRSLQNVVGDAITINTEREAGEDSGLVYDISTIDWDVLRAEFARSKTKNLETQTLKDAVEKQLQRMVRRNPLRMNLYERYLRIINDYNMETDRATIERTFEELLKLVQTLSEEDSRAVREGLTEEYLAVFDLLCQRRNDISTQTRNRIKRISQDLVESVKGKLGELSAWREKETTRAQVKTFIHDYLYADTTGLPGDEYSDDEVENLSNVVYLHVFQQYKSPECNTYREAA
jgi:type I restriction enzyme R subunit